MSTVSSAAPTVACLKSLSRQYIQRFDRFLGFKNEPHLDEEDIIQKKTMRWIEKFHIAEGKKLEAIAAAKFGAFIAKCHPLCDPKLVSIVARYVTWLFLYDDKIERKTTEVEAKHALTQRILQGGDVDASDPNLMKGLHYVVQKMYKRAPSKEWQERFIKESASYCHSTLKEADNRANNLVPSLDEYLVERPEFSGTKITFLLVLFVEGFSLPNEVLDSEYVKEFILLAGNVVNWGNDYFSIPREWEKGDVHNLIIVLQHAIENCSFEQAFEEGSVMFEENFKKLELHVAKASEHGKDVVRFVEGVMQWLAGHHNWAKESARYNS